MRVVLRLKVNSDCAGRLEIADVTAQALIEKNRALKLSLAKLLRECSVQQWTHLKDKEERQLLKVIRAVF